MGRSGTASARSSMIEASAAASDGRSESIAEVHLGGSRGIGAGRHEVAPAPLSVDRPYLWLTAFFSAAPALNRGTLEAAI